MNKTIRSAPFTRQAMFLIFKIPDPRDSKKWRGPAIFEIRKVAGESTYFIPNHRHHRKKIRFYKHEFLLDNP